MSKSEAGSRKLELVATLGAALCMAFVAVAGPARAQSGQCLLEFKDQQGVVRDQLCAEGKTCTFQLQLCLDEASAGCTAGTFTKKVRTRGHCNPGKLQFKPSSGPCGAVQPIKVRTRKNGKKAGSCTIKASAHAKGTKASGQIVLACMPPGQCPATTTTTTTILGATTTTTTVLGGTTTTTIQGGSTTTTTTTLGGSTTTTTMGACDCCTNTQLQFTTAAPSNTVTGTVTSEGTCVPGGEPCDVVTAAGDCSTTGATCTGPPATTLSLTAGGLYFGGSGTAVPLPNQVPDQGMSVLKVTSCVAPNYSLAATLDTDLTGAMPWRRCTSGPSVQSPEYPGKPGCLFGPPLPIPNGATSVCVINRVAADATGTGTCQGETNNLSLPLLSDLYLTGPALGNAPCPRCIPNGGGCASGTCCESGPNMGMACTPGSTLSGASNPTSHDCPPPAPFIGSLPIPFNLSTGTQTKTAANLAAGHKVFCGFCGSASGSTPTAFKGVCMGGTQDGNSCNNDPSTCVSGGGACLPTPCTSDSECSTFTMGCGATGASACNRCRQRTDGAFQQGVAHTITETGAPANACIATGTHASTLVSVFCIPPSYNATVDGNGDLPSPGAVSLPGTGQMLP